MNNGNPAPDQAFLPVIIEKKTRGKDVASDLRNKIIAFILDSRIIEDGKLVSPRGIYKVAANSFTNNDGNPMSVSTVKRIWKKACLSRQAPEKEAYRASLERKGRCGRPKVYNREEVKEAIEEVPYWQRESFSSLATHTDIP
jgi:hypothetical protein